MSLLRHIAILFALLAFTPLRAMGGDDAALISHLETSVGTSLATDEEVPFWIWSNRSGMVPDDEGAMAFTRLKFGRTPDEWKTFDWHYGIDVTARTAGDSSLLWTDAYIGADYGKFSLTLGRKAEFFGLADSLLSVGSEAYSRNAPTIPKAALSTKGFASVTDWLGVNAYVAHGWLGEEQYVPNSFLHEKFLYLKLGSDVPDEGLNVMAGLHHLAVWGGEGKPSGLDDYLDIFIGNEGGSDADLNDRYNALGNHLGSIEYAVQFKGYYRDWYLYLQTLFEDGSGLRFWFPDWFKGDYLVGGSLIDKNADTPFRRLNIEYLDTRFDGYQPAGHPDNYFDNSVYGGWVHEGWAIGHPFIRFTQAAQNDYTPINRLRGANLSLLWAFSDAVNPLVRIGWVRSSGSFSQPLSGEEKTTLVAFDLSNTLYLNNGWTLAQQLSLDTGDEVDSVLGVFLMASKSLF